jgi:uncharacterized membrane protein YdcZ (DUF606 family)
MPSTWKPHREPFSATLSRTIGIALVVGGLAAWRYRTLQVWPIAAVIMLWFSFGGHWVELWFLNQVRPRLSHARTTQIATRVVVWFVGGVVLGLGIVLTMRLFPLTRALRPPPWWMAGVVFIALELVVHLVLFARRRPNCYSGDG